MILNADLPCNGALHLAAYGVGAEASAQKVHQFGQGSLYGRVVATDDAGLEELAPGLIHPHLYTPRAALSDVDDDLTGFGGLGERFGEPRETRGVAASEGAENDALIC